MNVEEFMRQLAAETARLVGQQPPKSYTVKRADPMRGSREQITSLPQIMAELCDALKLEAMAQASLASMLKMHVETLQDNNRLMAEFTLVADEHRKLFAAVIRARRRKRDNG